MLTQVIVWTIIKWNSGSGSLGIEFIGLYQEKTEMMSSECTINKINVVKRVESEP